MRTTTRISLIVVSAVEQVLIARAEIQFYVIFSLIDQIIHLTRKYQAGIRCIGWLEKGITLFRLI